MSSSLSSNMSKYKAGDTVWLASAPSIQPTLGVLAAGFTKSQHHNNMYEHDNPEITAFVPLNRGTKRPNWDAAFPIQRMTLQVAKSRIKCAKLYNQAIQSQIDRLQENYNRKKTSLRNKMIHERNTIPMPESNNTNQLEVETPMGTLVAYPSIDPKNPGIFIDLKRHGTTCALALAMTECQTHENDETHEIVSRIWGDGKNEDATYATHHVNIDAGFNDD